MVVASPRIYSGFRIFIIAFALLSILYNTLSTYLLHQLPPSPTSPFSSHPSYSSPSYPYINLTLYTLFATFSSLLGFVGAVTNHTDTLLIFSHFLLLDTVLTAVPVFGGLYLAPGLKGRACADAVGVEGCEKIFNTALVLVGVAAASATVCKVGVAAVVRWYALRLENLRTPVVEQEEEAWMLKV